MFLICRAKLNETKLVQKLRVKPNGVNAVALAIGQKVTTEDLVLKVPIYPYFLMQRNAKSIHLFV